MASTTESPKAVFRKLPRKNLANFRLDKRGASESIAEYLARNRITDEETAWVQSQPVVGTPSLRRLRDKMVERGFVGVRLEVNANGQDLGVQARLTAQVEADDTTSLLRLMITLLRAAGFGAGFPETSIDSVDGPVISCHATIGPMEELVEHGPPAIELEDGR